MQLSVSKTHPDFDAMVALSGEFDAYGCREIRADLEQIVVDFPARKIALDLSKVTFIDSSGVGAIVFLHKRMLSAGGSISLIGVRGQPKELLQLLRVGEAIATEWA